MRAWIVAALLLPLPLLAQEDTGSDSVDTGLDNIWFPGEFAVAPLLAFPLEIRPSAALLWVERDIDDSIDGWNLEARVGIGFRLPVVRFQDEGPSRPAIDLGFDVGVWSRFFMETLEKEQIDTDWKIAVPLGLRYRIWDFRVTLQHVSSHFGDDYLDDNPQEVFQSSREGFELLLGVRPGFDARFYVGGDLNLGRSEDFIGGEEPGDPVFVFTTVEKWAFRFGAEWDQTRWGSKRIAPFAAANFEINEFTDRIATLLKAGASFRVKSIRLYLDLEYHSGPSSMGQFRTVDETWVGLNFMGEL
ncbi:MAG: DUF1207 domain-containing protein [marine benthic group bacterium]|nr:DUF1207 domain-containing protein [Gemmatimonadota bacterium]